MEKFHFPWLRFFWVPFISFLFCVIDWSIILTDEFVQPFVEGMRHKAPYDILLSTVYTLLCSEVSLRFFSRLQTWFPLENRIKTLITVHVLVSSLVWMEMFTLSQALLYGFDTPMKVFMFKQNITLAIMIALMMNVVHIGMILFNRWKEAHTEAEDLKRTSLEAQNAALRQHIDPHFLFNSLNTLTALIEEEPKSAVRFVHQLSNVYRYVLQSKNHVTVLLSEELAFVRAYSYLHELRFGENFCVTIAVPESAEHCVVPPFVVQLCIENAVKHNVVSRQKPLRIMVSVHGDMLRVSNNLQRKCNVSTSTHLGLSTIRHRYSLLTEKQVVVSETSNEFAVELPLLPAPKPTVESSLAMASKTASIQDFDYV